MTQESKDNKESNKKENKLLDWFKFITGLMFAGVIIYKIASSNLGFDFSKFDFNALLALILSLFAITLSVAFYFKATDTSNLFYDNTYKFTKEISEILGRIEAGFGERLRHLDEGYSGLVNKFDNGSSEQNIKETKEEIEREKLKLKQEIQERNNILNSLIEKAQLEQHEKEQIRKELKEKELDISKQNRELNFLKHRLETENEELNIDTLPQAVLRQFVHFIKQTKEPEVFLKYPSSMISRKYKFALNEVSKSDFQTLMNLRLLNEDGSFTISGIKVLKQLARRIM